MRRVCFLLIVLFLACSSFPVLAAPPHPKLLQEVREGLRPEPGYLKHIREVGPPPVRGERKALTALRKRGLFPKGGYETFRAPGTDAQDGTTAAPSLAPPAVGNQKALVLLVSFSDESEQVAAAFFDTLVFSGTGPPASPSVNHYYQEVSRGQFGIYTLPSDLPSAQGWYALPGTKADYNVDSSLQSMLQDAIAAADPFVDFSPYDSDGDGKVDYLLLVHAGTGGEGPASGPGDIYSRTVVLSKAEPTADGVGVDTFMTVPEYWVTPGDMTIGVYVHEFSHLLGLIDLYDRGNDSAGIGDWGLMGLGTWNGVNGSSPAWLSAYSRVALEWETPVVPEVNLFGETLLPVEEGGSVYTLWNDGGTGSEFFLLENRQKTGYDAGLAYHGLLIWHVDENMDSNDNHLLGHQDCEWPTHYRVALQQADGRLELETSYHPNLPSGDSGDPYPGLEGNREFSLSSVPNSGSYADCLSKVAVLNVHESGTDGSIVADLLPSAPPAFQAEDYYAFSPLFPGDEVLLNVSLVNTGSGATGISAELVSYDPWVTVTAAAASYPDLEFGEGAENLVPFRVSVDHPDAAPGALVDLELHVTADGGHGEVVGFPVVLEPAGVLLIDDDQGDSHDSSALMGPLDNTERAAGYWDHLLRGTPALSFLDRFPSLLWTTGPTTTDTLSPDEELLLEDYLDGGGSLLLSSQSYFRSSCGALNGFQQNYLDIFQLICTSPALPYVSVQGYQFDPVSADLGPYALTFPSGFPNQVVFVRPPPEGFSSELFTDEGGRWAAIKHPDPVFRTSSFGFPLEVLAENDQTETFGRFLPWLRPVGGDSSGNGLADLLVVRPRDTVVKDLVLLESAGYALGDPAVWGEMSGTADFLLRGDLNGDGLGDVAVGTVIDPDTVQWSGHLASLVYVPGVGFQKAFDAPFIWAVDVGNAESRCFLGDADGDGSEDLICAEPDPSRASLAVWHVALSDGVSFSDPQVWADPFGKMTQGSLLVGDVNGDGYADLIWGKSNSSVALSNGISFLEVKTWKDGSGYSKTHFLIGDVNGDGMDDLTYWYDGKNGPVKWKVSLSTGNSFDHGQNWTGGFGMHSWEGFSLTDLDGNGRSDLIGWRQTGGSYVFDAAFSMGDYFDEGRTVGQFTAQPGDRIFP